VLIVRNLISCSLMLNRNVRQLIPLLRSTYLTDYYVTREYSALDLLKTVTDKAVKHTDIIKKSIYNPNDNTCLIQRILLVSTRITKVFKPSNLSPIRVFNPFNLQQLPLPPFVG